ncbi:MAG: MFS transporter [Anaerolineaceae bacterium]
MTPTHQRFTGMFGFILVWIGQIISLLGTTMTGFGLTIWAFEKTGSATALTLVGFFFVTPMLIFSPIAGAIVDRYNRKFLMILSDLISGLTSIFILIMVIGGYLQIWHLYLTCFIQGIFQTFQWPAYSAAISTMLPKEQFGRANGMMGLADSASGVLGPLLAGALLGIIGLKGILIIDIITFLIAIGTLLIVFIPQPKTTIEGQKSRGNLWSESVFGFRYILERPSLLGLQLVFLIGNFFFSIPVSILSPMILASTQNNEMMLASVNSAGAIGGVVGGLVMSAWGGPKRRVHGVLLGWVFSSLAFVVLGAGRNLPIWVIANFVSMFFSIMVNASNQSIWQSKVEPDVQGRVFAIRRLIAWFVNPLALLIAGPLADHLFEPAMKEGGALASSFCWLVGVGPGRGMALIFVIFGSLATISSACAYFFRVIRDAEIILPDHDTLEG